MRSLLTLVLIGALAFAAIRYLDPWLDDVLASDVPAPDPSKTSDPTDSTVPVDPEQPATPAPSVAPGQATVAAGEKLTLTPAQGLARLPIAAEDRQAYRRADFGKGWIDADGNCRDTRAEVLARESTVKVAAGCKVFRGQWYSYYDGLTWKQSNEVQIDHLVPLAEAWDSGAFTWDAATRLAYANDLGDRRVLVPTTTALNYAKVADDPQWYLPKVNRCRYATSWIAVKLRWRMTVDQREHDALATAVADCPAERFSVTRAGQRLLPFAAGTGTQNRSVSLVSIDYRGTEKVVIRNGGSKVADLDGWVLRDDIGYGQFRIPRTSLPAGGTLTVLSTTGKDRTDDGGNVVRYAGWGDVWNDSGDTAVLIDGRRQETDSCRYRGGDSGKTRC